VATVVYTDGACSGNPGPGGWAWAVPGGAFASGAAARTTNQRMEVEAAYEAVKANAGTLRVVSDSTYVVNCFRDRWWEGWLKRGWLNSQKKPVANRDLWEPFVELVQARRDVTFQWIKGHSGDPMNDLVDRLAVEAATTQRGRHGDEPPEDLGPPDDPRPSARARGAGSGSGGAPSSVAGSPPIPQIPGHPLVVLGHRPTELGGYEGNPLASAVLARLAEILAAKATLEPELVVVSGLRLGAEMLGAEAAIEAGLPFVAVLPYPEPQSVWPAASQERFAQLLGAARDVITLQKRVPSSKQQAGAALARRDAWLARHAAEAILVWDGKDPGLGRLARSLEDHLGEDLWLVDPNELTVDHRPA
jgi:ribonuclease HI